MPDNGGSVFIAIYPAGSAALGAEVDAVSQTTFKQISIVAGQNWTVSGPDAFVEDTAKVLGGTVTTSP